MEFISNETLPEKKKKSVAFKVFAITIIVLTIFSLGYFTLNFISANKTLRLYNRMYGTSSMDSSPISFVPYSIAFLEARHTMSKVDSVSLSINLNDSLAALEMGGVVVFEANLEGRRVSPLLMALKPEALSNLLRKPTRVISYYATIEKEEIIVKQAPRDTTEAALDDDELPVVTRKAAFFTLHLDSGIRLVVMPHEESGLEWFKFIAHQNLQLFWHHIKVLFKGELPEYIPIVTIDVSAEDAKTIFRALPENAQVSLKL